MQFVFFKCKRYRTLSLNPDGPGGGQGGPRHYLTPCFLGHVGYFGADACDRRRSVLGPLQGPLSGSLEEEPRSTEDFRLVRIGVVFSGTFFGLNIVLS